ncbi:MAG: SDR family oxidoreductase [Flavobacteriaceae bacterium]|nr:SDR family oxidoreductase [Flavobacteriaceae bacterium]MDG1961710.1 SDR family oxidoreductase [Flavobacteriaceae bacterium]
MKLKDEKILVTGGAGFIGSHLCDRFIAEGAEVVCLDDLSTGFVRNIEQLMDHERFTFIEGDVRNLDTCRNAVKGCTQVSHQAALGSVPRSIKFPEQTMSVNVQGFVNVCKASFDAGVERLVYASSSSVYGDVIELPKVEHLIGRPLSPYALSKQTTESFAAQCALHYGLSCVGLRYFNVFGPRQHPEGPYAAVIPRFVRALDQQQALPINGDGQQTRDFTYIDNVVAANLLALTSRRQDTHALYNVAAGGQTSVNTLAELLLELYFDEVGDTDVHQKIIYGPKRQGDIEHSYADIGKAQHELGYRPHVSFSEGLQRTVTSLQRNRQQHG